MEWYVYTAPYRRFLGTVWARTAAEAGREASRIWVGWPLIVSTRHPATLEGVTHD